MTFRKRSMVTGQKLQRLLWKTWAATPRPVRSLVPRDSAPGRMARRIGQSTATFRPHDAIYGEDYYVKTYGSLGDLHVHRLRRVRGKRL